jgi:hypothetical protein
MLTSSPPQPSSIADVAPQYRRDLFPTSPLPQTKPEAHAISQKTYVETQNNTCLKAAQEDIAHGSVSSMPEPYCAHHARHPMFHRAETNSILA